MNLADVLQAVVVVVATALIFYKAGYEMGRLDQMLRDNINKEEKGNGIPPI